MKIKLWFRIQPGPAGTIRTFARGKIAAWMVVFLFICGFGGCEKRGPLDPTVGMDLADNLWIRVLLFDNIKECRISCESGFTVTDTESGAKAVFNATDEQFVVGIAEGRVKIGLQPFGSDVLIEPASPFVFTINGKGYRGNLKISLNDTATGFKALNAVPIESYLAGVVGAEMPSYWETEALKAQTIAARSYCLYIKRTQGIKRTWDLKASQAHQVYRGIEAETKTVWNAINQTQGKVAVYKDSEGQQQILPAFYSSACGGNTESSKEVFGTGYPPLKSVKCTYCKKVAKKDFYRWPAVEFDAKQVSDRIIKNYPKLQSLGRIETIQPSRETNGRIVSVKLVGNDKKTATLRGEDLRLTLDPSGMKIKSTACKIAQKNGKFRFYDGKGFGHGVGMCQCGAEGMARKGKSAKKILEHYYNGSKIVKLY